MNVGDYVRTKSYGIKKINGFSSTLEADFIDCDYDKYQKVLINKKDVVNSSSNIIDLIEVGDYVNGYFVNEITDIDTGLPVLCNFDLNTMRWTPLEEIDIWYSIVIKEQFENMEYKV